jgi:hypothetical protein
VLLCAMLPFYVRDLAQGFRIDFVAYWCAGSAVLHHQDPYLDASVHQCNVELGLIHSLTLPIAHPPYVMPVFAALALLPEKISFALWCAVLLACFVSTVLALCRLTRLDWTLVAAATYLLLLPSFEFGQLVPIALCGFCWALVFVRDERPWAAAAALGIAAAMPNFAEAAWIAAFLCSPKIRLPLFAAGAVLVLIGVASIHWPTILEYAGAALPAYGRSELTAFWQLGSAATLHAAGLSDAAALRVAYALLAAFVAAGIYAGLQLSRRFGGAHWVVAAAVAFGIVGSPYVHESDIVLALPLALMLLSSLPDSKLVRTAALIVVVPWQHLTNDVGVQSAIAIPLLLVVAAAFFSRAIVAAAVVAAISLSSLALYRVLGSAEAQTSAAQTLPVRVLPPNALAEVRWTEFTENSRSVKGAFAYRLFAYVALGSLIAVTFLEAGGEKRPLRSTA